MKTTKAQKEQYKGPLKNFNIPVYLGPHVTFLHSNPLDIVNLEAIKVYIFPLIERLK